MKKVSLVFCLIVFTIILVEHIQAQKTVNKIMPEEDFTLKPLKVGDSIQNYQFKISLNFPNRTAKISDFEGKLIILDFWNSHCLSCIESWPKMISLQKEFDGKIQIILVNSYENESICRQIFQRVGKTVNITLPTVCGDTTLEKLFPHSGVPHVVWIDNRIIRAITDGGPVKSKNIQSILNNEQINLSKKIDNSEMIHRKGYLNTPLFIDENGGKPIKIYAQSTFSKADDRLTFAYGIMANPKLGIYGALGTNICIRDLYSLAYSNKLFNPLSYDRLPLNRIILNVKDSTKYVDYVDDEIQRQNLYTYQLITPPLSLDEIQRMMQEDLKRYIGLNVHWEKRQLKCLVLTARDTMAIKYIDGNKMRDVGTGLKLNKVTVEDFIYALEHFLSAYAYSPYPIIDETAYKGLLGKIEANINVGNYEELDKALQKYKMRFQLQERGIDVLVLSEPEGYHFPFTLIK